MKNFLLLFFTLNFSLAFGQYIKQGEIEIGGKNNDYGNSLVQANDGGYVIAGSTTSFGSGKNDVYIVKLDYQGNLKWSRTVGGDSNDMGNSIIKTKDGGYALAGTTSSFGAGKNDVYVVKLDSVGNIEWTRTIGGTDDDEGNSIVQAKDGGYVIGGYTNSFGAGGYDVYVVKLDSLGNLKWAKTIGGIHNDEAYSILQTFDGGYALAGTTMSYGYDSATMNNVYIIKLDSMGSLKWTKTFSSEYNNGDEGYGIIQTKDNGYAVTGYENRNFNDALFMLKLDSVGDLKWGLADGGANSDVGYSIIQTKNNGYVITGFNIPWDDTTGGGFSILMIDSSGNPDGNKFILGGGTGATIILAKDNGYAIAGWDSNNKVCLVKFDSLFDICSPTNADMTILRYTDTTGNGGIENSSGAITSIDSGRVNSGGTETIDCIVTAVNNIAPKESSITVFPNPSNGKFTFELKDNNEKLKVEVYNMLGEKVYSQYSNPNTQYQIDLSNQPTGIYLYRITSEKGELVGSGKLVIE